MVIAVIAIIIFLTVIALNMHTTSEIQNMEKEIIIPSITPQTVQTGGLCKRDTECFITSCKDQIESCVNTTQLTFYSKNCKTYSDWIVGKQDISRCNCIQNTCIMR